MKLATTQRKGAALLLVLGTLILVSTAAAILVSAASSATLRRTLDASELLADDLLIAAEAPIQQWLTEKSARAVPSPEASEPMISILRHSWNGAPNEGGGDFELQITAWDQRGMLPAQLVEASSAWRALLPSGFTQIPHSLADEASSAGLDQHLYIGGVDAKGHLTGPFPAAPVTEPIECFGEADRAASHSSAGEPARTERTVATGSFLDTHHSEPYALNVNTAPIALLRRCFEASHVSGIDQIMAARRQGKPASSSGRITLPGTDPEHSLQLVSSSSVWAFRIDVRVNRLRKSWWAVYEPARSASKSSKTKQSSWECVQRLVITH
jgi:hypothetical protein